MKNTKYHTLHVSYYMYIHYECMLYMYVIVFFFVHVVEKFKYQRISFPVIYYYDCYIYYIVIVPQRHYDIFMFGP